MLPEEVNVASDRGKTFFGSSIDFDKVKIKPSPFLSAGRPWTCGNVIRTQKPQPGDKPTVYPPSLIHEYGHIWQHQHGQLVFVKAIFEQARGIISKSNPYEYGGLEGLKRSDTLSSFFIESQAQIITDYWISQHDLQDTQFSQEHKDNLERLVQGAKVVSTAPGKVTVASTIDSAVAFVVNLVLGIFE